MGCRSTFASLASVSVAQVIAEWIQSLWDSTRYAWFQVEIQQSCRVNAHAHTRTHTYTHSLDSPNQCRATSVSGWVTRDTHAYLKRARTPTRSHAHTHTHTHTHTHCTVLPPCVSGTLSISMPHFLQHTHAHHAHTHAHTYSPAARPCSHQCPGPSASVSVAAWSV